MDWDGIIDKEEINRKWRWSTRARSWSSCSWWSTAPFHSISWVPSPIFIDVVVGLLVVNMFLLFFRLYQHFSLYFLILRLHVTRALVFLEVLGHLLFYISVFRYFWSRNEGVCYHFPFCLAFLVLSFHIIFNFFLALPFVNIFSFFLELVASGLIKNCDLLVESKKEVGLFLVDFVHRLVVVDFVHRLVVVDFVHRLVEVKNQVFDFWIKLAITDARFKNIFGKWVIVLVVTLDNPNDFIYYVGLDLSYRFFKGRA